MSGFLKVIYIIEKICRSSMFGRFVLTSPDLQEIEIQDEKQYSVTASGTSKMIKIIEHILRRIQRIIVE